MKTSKRFLSNATCILFLTLGLSAVLVGFTVGGVVVETGEETGEAPLPEGSGPSGTTEQQQESYDIIPPLQDPSQLFPSYPGNSGSVLPMPPTYSNPNAAQPNMPMPPTGYGPYGSPSPQQQQGQQQQQTGFDPTGNPLGGANQGMMPQSPTGSGGGSSMMPNAPTPGQNLNQLGIADPQYGRFESARLEASLMPHQAPYLNATRNQVIRGGKPFSGYRQPPVYSPYMSLMRTQDSIRGIDNYYEYVMPKIEQQQREKQVSREIMGLQSTARSEYEALQQMKQRPGSAPVQSGSLAPATFMNTGNYFGQGKK
ncbi:MAG: hypothetical protein PVH19_15895 [Planctomycetia bacterium]|jgi:hypothetical protein